MHVGVCMFVYVYAYMHECMLQKNQFCYLLILLPDFSLQDQDNLWMDYTLFCPHNKKHVRLNWLRENNPNSLAQTQYTHLHPSPTPIDIHIHTQGKRWSYSRWSLERGREREFNLKYIVM